MSAEVIDAIFRQTRRTINISITGGEPFLVDEVIEYIIKKVKEYKVFVGNWKIVTNGTIYNRKMNLLLKKHSKLCNYKGTNNHYGKIEISSDVYHRYTGEKPILKLLDEGNAANLKEDKELFDPITKYYVHISDEGIYFITPIFISPRGIIADCNASYEYQIGIYNYGNILEHTIVECLYDRLQKILTDEELAEIMLLKMKK